MAPQLRGLCSSRDTPTPLFDTTKELKKNQVKDGGDSYSGWQTNPGSFHLSL